MTIVYAHYDRELHRHATETLAKQVFEAQFYEEIDNVLNDPAADKSILAFEQSRVVGFALVGMRNPLGAMLGFHSTPNNRYIELAFLGVDPDMQGKGIGSGLLQRVKDLGFENVWLQVFYNNPDARRLYERHGFEHWRTFGTRNDGGYVMGFSRPRHERLLRLRPRVCAYPDETWVPSMQYPQNDSTQVPCFLRH